MVSIRLLLQMATNPINTLKTLIRRTAGWTAALGLALTVAAGLRTDSVGDEARVWASAQATARPLDAQAITGAAQWHLQRVGAPQAWQASRGQGAMIAIIDSGVDAEHPDLQGRVLPGWNVLEDSPDTSDTRGHGTAVAGAAAAGFHHSGPLAGVAGDALILPLKVTDSRGYTSVGAVVKAIHMAADRGARVVNVSFESVGAHPAVLKAAQYLQQRGGVLVVPSGNRGVQQQVPSSAHVVTVAATGRQDEHPNWSTHGPHVTVSAPGQSLLLPDLGGRYREVSGTSYASPLVAGVLALMVAAYPDATPAQLRQALESSAHDLGEPGADPMFGAGRVDAAAALLALARTSSAR